MTIITNKNIFKIISIVLISIIVISIVSPVFAAYTDSFKNGDKLKFSGNSWCVYKTQAAAKDFDNSKIKRYLSKNTTITIKSKNGNVLEIGSNEYIYYGSTASKYFSKISSTSSSTSTQPSNISSSSNSSSTRKSFLSALLSNLSKQAEQRKALTNSFSNLLGNLFSSSTKKTLSSSSSSTSSKAPSQPIVTNNTVTIPSETASGYKFYYNNLSDKCKKVYRYLYSKEDDFIGGKDIDLIKLRNTVGGNLIPFEVFAVTHALEKDFPEFQYILTCNKIVCYKTTNDQVTKLSFKSTDSSLKNNLKSIDSIVNTLIKNVNGKNTYDKLKYLNDYICNNMTYQTGNALSIDGFTNKKGQCMTYAMMYKYLLNKLNIDCIYVVGKAPDRSGSLALHAWNYVKVNGSWYGVDVCWNDTTSSKGISYKYFLKGKSTFSNRTLDTSSYPSLCNSNY